ncbi:MAG: DNA repair protein RecN [Firmicutes bacterium HGW-Firmicutes-15]|nr:MAG: DNA repair protein RecN [Firmicutes bacterium HGW-Firmicutes-15]
MLQEIYISNFVLIDELRMEFSTGLNVVSGETGAGKSIIIDALGLLLGERIKNDYIRDQSRKAVAEAVFEVRNNTDARVFLLEQGLVDDDEEIENIVLSREIHPSGKTAARINGRNVSVSTLKMLSTYLVDMHLQNDRQNILRPVNYLGYVDGFAEDIDDLLQNIARLYSLISTRRKQLEELGLNQQNRVQRLDFLTYQIKEIEESELRECEEEELKELRDRIKNAGKLMEGSSRIFELLYSSEKVSSAYDQVSFALDVTQDLKSDSFFADMVEPLENIYYSLQDLSGRISAFKDRLEFEPGHLEGIEDRLYRISKLKNKYGENIKDILAYLENARADREALDQSDELQAEIEQEIMNLDAQYMQLAAEISRKRKKAALLLEEKVHNELQGLNMPDIKFQVAVIEKSNQGSNGMDDIDFLFSPNPGEEMRPVTRIASGGEISRFILALKKALADVYNIPTLVFDEIDVGLGGSALNAVARKLAELSRAHQLILVTHSPQVASYAEQNFIIDKYVEDDRTFTRVKSLDAQEKVREIARMLDGEKYSDLTLEHAREMIAMANPYSSKN